MAKYLGSAKRELERLYVAKQPALVGTAWDGVGSIRAGERVFVTCKGPGKKAQEATLVQMWPLGLAEERPV